MMLKQTLLELGRHHRAALSVRDRADFEDELDRLRMMRLAEEGLGLGDLLPDFALEDVAAWQGRPPLEAAMTFSKRLPVREI